MFIYQRSAVETPGLGRRARSNKGPRAWFLLGLVLLLLSSPVAAKDWVYVARPGDNLWDLAAEYLVSMRYWQQFRALNNVPNPRQMPPGTRVRFPVEWLRLKPAPATMVEVAGSVTVIRAGQSVPTSISTGASLVSGDRIVTGADGSAVLRFADDSRLLLRPQSELHMDDLGVYGRTGMVDTRARLHRGGVETVVPGSNIPRTRFEISTPSASAVVRGTEFRVSTQASPSLSRAEVLAGMVGVAGTQGRELNLPAGSGTVVQAGKPPTKPRALLPPADLSNIALLIERRLLRMDWLPVEGASAYQAQIVATDGTSTLLLDRRVPVPHVILPDLPDGSYSLKIRAVDELGLEGREALRLFTLNARPEPPFAMEPRPDRTVRVTRPRFQWTSPAEARSYRFQLSADADYQTILAENDAVATTGLESPVELGAGEYFWRVATRDAGGEVGPFGDTQTFELRPTPLAPAEAQTQIGEDVVDLRWPAGLPGQIYEVQFASDETFSADLRSELLDKPELTMSRPEKSLWFRVRTIDIDGHQGPYGTVQRILIPEPTPWYLLGIPLLWLLPAL